MAGPGFVSAELEVRALKALFNALVGKSFEEVRAVDQSGVQDTDFASHANRALFRRVVMHLRKGEDLDVFAACQESGLAEADIMALAVNDEFWPAESLLKKLKETSREENARRLIDELALKPFDELAPGLDEVSGKIKASAVLHFPRLADDLTKVVDRIVANRLGKGAYTLRTGLSELDEYTGGLPINLTIVGSLPGAGKSSLVAGIARLLAKRGDTVGVVSLEDARDWIVDRCIAQESRVPLVDLRARALSDEQERRVEEGMAVFAEYSERLLVDDRENQRVGDVVATAQKMAHAGAKCIIVDHLGEIVVPRSDRHDLEIAEAVRRLRAISKTHNVPVILVCHLRRKEGAEDLFARPMLTDFAFSAAIERAARLAIGICREKDDETCLMAHVLKNTSGPSGRAIRLNFSFRAPMVVPGLNELF